MGFVDADAHVWESIDTWSYFDPAERDYAPVDATRPWQVEDMSVSLQAIPRGGMYQIYPDGAQDLRDVPTRLRQLDELGIDVQICFSSFWLIQEIHNPLREAAMQRSWNRWMAERAAESGGRLRWMCQVPLRDAERASEEILFAKEHGAVGMETLGIRNGTPLGHPSLNRVYAQLQDLDMVLGVHVGGPMRDYLINPDAYWYFHTAPVPAAMHNLINTDISSRFPRLRIAFVEAGGSWAPHVLCDRFRGDRNSATRVFGDWRKRATDFVDRSNMYVSCYMDDDLDYLAGYLRTDRMMIGSDYGHIDFAADPNALWTVDNSQSLDRSFRDQLVDANARQCYGIDPSFRPADAFATASPKGAAIMAQLEALIAAGDIEPNTGSVFDRASSTAVTH